MIDNKLIVQLAVTDTDALDRLGRVPAAFVVCARALRIREQLRDQSIAMRTLRAIPIACTIEEVAEEESSHRLVVTFRPDHIREDFPRDERIRTDRTDGPFGDYVRRMWEAAQGKHVIIYKALEDTGNEERPKIRVAPYVEAV